MIGWRSLENQSQRYRRRRGQASAPKGLGARSAERASVSRTSPGALAQELGTAVCWLGLQEEVCLILPAVKPVTVGKSVLHPKWVIVLKDVFQLWVYRWGSVVSLLSCVGLEFFLKEVAQLGKEGRQKGRQAGGKEGRRKERKERRKASHHTTVSLKGIQIRIIHTLVRFILKHCSTSFLLFRSSLLMAKSRSSALG